MKKVLVLLVMILVLTMSSCSIFDSYDIGYSKGYDSGYEAGFSNGQTAPKRLATPPSGTILEGREATKSEITVKADSSHNYVVTLKDQRKRVIVSFFVRSGATVTIGVPAQKLYVYFASGKDWYGYGEGLMFGENTYYSMDDELVDFNGKSWSYTLEEVRDGNFEETPIDMDDFFS